MRKFLAMLAVCIIIAVYAAIAATIGGKLVGLPRWLQIVYYAIAGVLWVLPLKPLMSWMNKAPQKDSPTD
ncbi:DUF2842 domain-containing protein [Ponticaulis profundi]|uniref:DUF2842 domain-containing protein n=1 Tax=Ponticaulis profundi TaxID=2665222 RepID=A0ABW1SEC0_9PROT